MSAPEPFRKAAKAYAAGPFAGALVPLPAGKKSPPQEGRTGTAGRTSRKTVKQDAKSSPRANVGLVAPPWLIGLDVDGDDHGEDKPGPATIAELEKRWGELPDTAYSTRHGAASATRIRWFEIPEGIKLREKLLRTEPDQPGGVEIIQHHHRFGVVWPSRLKDGTRYRWFTAEGEQVRTPTRDMIERLPDAWLDGLQDDRGEVDEHRLADEGVQGWIDDLQPGEPSRHVRDLIEAIGTGDVGNSTLLQHTGALVRAIDGAPGGAEAYAAFIEHIRGPYEDKYSRRKFDADLTRALGRAIGDHQARALTHTFSLADAPLRRQARAREAAPKQDKPKPKKKRHRSRELKHDEYTPTGAAGLISAPSRPQDVAQDLLGSNALPPLVYWREQWHVYQAGHWAARENSYVENLFHHVLAGAQYVGPDHARAWAPTIGKVREAMRAVQSHRQIADAERPPRWLDARGPATNLVPVANGILDLSTRELQPRSQQLFHLRPLRQEYDPHAGKPKTWLRVLEQQWGDDPDSIALLQEWFGYVISGDTSMQKAMVLTGPSRASKGTIAHVLSRLVGEDDTAGAALTDLTSRFGLEHLINAPLAIFGDARSQGKDMAMATDRLLEIIGGDKVSIDRKNRSQISERLGVRIMILGNLLPVFYDDSGVIAGRFLLLRTTTSFLGREDTTLMAQLETELGAILQWALDGYDRLKQNGRFTEPAAAASLRDEMRRNAAPILGFVEEACRTGDDLWVRKDELWTAYKTWAAESNVRLTTRRAFGRNLAAVGYRSAQRRLEDGDRVWVYEGLQPSTSAEERAARLWGTDAKIVTQVD